MKKRESLIGHEVPDGGPGEVDRSSIFGGGGFRERKGAEVVAADGEHREFRVFLGDAFGGGGTREESGTGGRDATTLELDTRS